MTGSVRVIGKVPWNILGFVNRIETIFVGKAAGQFKTGLFFVTIALFWLKLNIFIKYNRYVCGVMRN